MRVLALNPRESYTLAGLFESGCMLCCKRVVYGGIEDGACTTERADAVIDAIGENARHIDTVVSFGLHGYADVAEEVASRVGARVQFVTSEVRVCVRDVATLTGFPEIRRGTSFEGAELCAYLLNLGCAKAGLDPKRASVLVIDMDDSLLMAAVKNGEVVDFVNHLDEGPFYMRTAGGLAARAVVDRCFQNAGELDVMQLYTQKGGMLAYLDATDSRSMLRNLMCDAQQEVLIARAMAYQIGREIGALAVSLGGRVDLVAFSGELSRIGTIRTCLSERTRFVGNAVWLTEQDEVSGLANGVAMGG